MQYWQSIINSGLILKQHPLSFIKLKFFLEKNGFHVSSRLADALGMRSNSVRLFFIYLSCVTVGLGFVFYLIIAFVIRLKDLIRAKRNSVFDI
jgi:phage shock protein PspC (stress-responsive transcriptional regulator)